jgi:hypothetical protein
VLKLPSASLKSENQPTAVFAEPLVTFARAFCPSDVLKFGKAVSGAACVTGESAQQPISSGMRSKPHREAASLVEFLRFVSNDLIVLRSIFSIVRGFSRARGFLGIRRITYQCSCPELLPVKESDRKRLFFDLEFEGAHATCVAPPEKRVEV